ncbi:D-amino acid dehydrogenase [Novosphingobium sp. 1949]|uniref:D-amino acid dehydrogenase n=1 Tax=Novosphingobium organovorum TaxID=2930092 RepID=A0ABT0BFB2_9SPHN|nr:D-amino acid dehydrogenase [Novosphingobium organovorum]MCJ2183543.1 D-amino acid dehydrogenase [Novosphingobium organovorum]
MKIAVLGSGVVGVTSAWYLAEAGHEVTVIDRQEGPALETSFANAGQISPGYASPWAAPGIPVKAIKWMLKKHSPLIVRPRPDPAMLRWLAAMLANCNARAYAINKSRMVRLAEYSRDCLDTLRDETGIAYDARTQGTLQLFRKQKDLDAVAKDVAVLEADGVPFELLDTAGCIAAEPGLAKARAPFVGGLRLPHDETGDCFKFTNALAQMAAARGVEFRSGTAIHRLVEEGGRIVRVDTDKGPVTADAYLTALGSFSPHLLAPLGLRLPIYPVKGYSLTVPITRPEEAPVSTLLDETYKVAVTRLGDRIRIGGMAEVSGYTLTLPETRRETLIHSAASLFPEAGDFAAGTFWSGLRPMTPDSTPIIGATRYSNLYLNTGHGTLGWTMACGSGQVIADLISGKRPAIEAGDLSLARY